MKEYFAIASESLDAYRQANGSYNIAHYHMLRDDNIEGLKVKIAKACDMQGRPKKWTIFEAIGEMEPKTVPLIFRKF